MLAVGTAMAPAQGVAAPFAAYVMDARTGKPVYAQNATTRLHPASLTKMMTLYLAFAAVERGQVRLDSRFTVSSNAAAEPPSKLGLRAGQQIELRYLLRAAAIKSANDAATAIGEGIAGSEEAFAAQMTATAKALGMRNTNFRNANGLTQDGHYSTAEDMSILGRRLFYDFPQYYNLFSRRSADAGVTTVSSTNKRFLDAYPGADGIKTGYTRAAGFNLTASAHRGNKRIVATVFGGTSTAQRNQVMAQLLDAGFGRVPARVREVRPEPPQLLAQKVVRRAQVEPKPIATAPRAERMVLTRSEPPRRASAAASTVRPDQLAAAVAQAIATPAAAATPDPAASVPADARMSLASSARPARRAGTAQAVEPSAVDAAVEMAASAPAAAPSGSIAGGVLQSSARPVPSPRSGSASTASLDETDETASAPIAQPATTAEVAPAAVASAAPVAAAASRVMALASSTAPAPRSDTVILAAMGEGDRGEPEPTELVSRAKSGGTGWGITLGPIKSKTEADKLLMQTVLQGGDAVARAHRSVADTARGWEPRMAGMSRSTAQALCDQMAARANSCSVIQQ
ncbi:D-alanyl-D-alanine carboxypeptidase [Paracoccus sp. TK19116]|uniref:D-alanyl-D-alanine carboxypeptidase n=2 Tax=Paracoccus albicereus TaxID=2922394 RepID=A0ABT1MNR8_9RHOB|nr:D-alanyl-D-alanine carboxypeptidase family protein [Paracoccus albicereus]MCQ0969937.1 D-alanyl-D-alanine carboxypeptidase [Paracoccus albicereus]